MLGSSYNHNVASNKVNDMMDEMFHFVSNCEDEEVARGIAPLPGVLGTLNKLASDYDVACGLVTGNVEGIARRKMQTLNIHSTNAFTPLHEPQGGRIWDGVEEIRFLGGFGSGKVIHVGDAPADILAAKSYVDHPTKPRGVCVSVVGVATGSYSVEELRELCGKSIPGVWEPVILEQGRGVGDADVFLRACGLV